LGKYASHTWPLFHITLNNFITLLAYYLSLRTGSSWFFFATIFLILCIFPRYSRVSKYYLFIYFVGLVFELRASHLQSSCSTSLATPPVHFALVILEMESQDLFAYFALVTLEMESQDSNDAI
jgi:hypothetical protein